MERGKKAQRQAGCEVCGQGLENCFEVHLGGERHIFDSFECAVLGLMPRCHLCGCMILGPGVIARNNLYCSYSCASFCRVREYKPLVRVAKRASL